MTAYYNENDPKTAAWLKELIKAKLIADGEVDTRSIVDVQPGDLAGFRQCHFFAGIGGWSYALRLAGWPDDREVWTGSCPCQPWSSAGQGFGADDPRDLWPAWFKLISQCRPAIVFGEQVAGKAGFAWLDRVHDDLEADGYAIGAVDLPACSVGAWHRRQRVWFVAAAMCAASEWRAGSFSGAEAESDSAREFNGRGADGFGDGSEDRDLADTEGRRCGQGRQNAPGCGERAVTEGAGMRPADDCGVSLGHPGSMVRRSARNDSAGPSAEWVQAAGQSQRSGAQFWANVEWLECRDGRTRPTQPGLCPVANGVSGRVVLLRGAGNAIVPQVAAEVIGAYMEICHD